MSENKVESDLGTSMSVHDNMFRIDLQNYSYCNILKSSSIVI